MQVGEQGAFLIYITDDRVVKEGLEIKGLTNVDDGLKMINRVEQSGSSSGSYRRSQVQILTRYQIISKVRRYLSASNPFLCLF